MIDLLGASAASNARVLGCFFVGLAFGAAMAPSVIRRLERPWRAAAAAEAGVGILALPALLLTWWTGWIWPTLGADRLTGWEGAAIKLVLSVLVVFPPAVCMGLFLPLLANAVLGGHRDMTRHGLWLYATNTLGGVIGTVLVAIIALPAGGADRSMLMAIGMNLLVAVSCLGLDAGAARHRSRRHPVSHSDSIPPRILWPSLAVAFWSGAGILGFEVLAVQLVAMAAPLSFYAPTAVLAVVILLLGIAAFLAPLPFSKGVTAPGLTWGALNATAVFMALSPLLYRFLVDWISPHPGSSLVGFLASLIAGVLLAMGPTVLVAGLVFPSVLAWLGGEGGDRYGRRWGWLLAANGVGGLIGAEATYRWIMPAMGVGAGMAGVAALYALAALVWALLRPPRVGRVAASAAVILLVLALRFEPLSGMLEWNPSDGIVLNSWTGREGPVAVVESEDTGRRIVMSNQYTLGGTKLRYDQARLAHIPLVLHPHPRQVACIGLATGITSGAALEHRDVEKLTVLELSPLVVRAADEYFLPFNHAVTRDPRATVIVEDARTYLAARADAFDVVIGDLFLPWAAGEGRLYSREHFRSVRAALKSGGVFCQWLAMYQLTPEHFRTIQATFCEVFPRAFLFRGTWNTDRPLLALVGFRDADLDWPTVAARCNELRETEQVQDPLIRHPDGPAMLFLGTVDRSEVAEDAINTLSNMRVELDAGRVRVTGRPGLSYLQGERWLRFVYEQFLARLGASSGITPEQVQLAWLGQRLSLWEAMRTSAGRLSPEDQTQIPVVRDEIRRQFPKSISDDNAADWTQWPGDAALIRTASESK